MLMFERCKLCKKKVTMNTSGGYMEMDDGLYHYKCVCKYGYQKFLKDKNEDKDKNEGIRMKKSKEKLEYEEKKMKESRKYHEELKNKERIKREEEYKSGNCDEINKIKEKYKILIIPEDIIMFLINPDKNDFKKLSLIYHPDKGGDENYFKILNEYNK